MYRVAFTHVIPAIDAIRNAGASRASHRSFFLFFLSFSFRLFCTSLAVPSASLFHTPYSLPILPFMHHVLPLFHPLNFSFRKARIVPTLPLIISPLNYTDTPHVISFCKNHPVFLLENYRLILMNCL